MNRIPVFSGNGITTTEDCAMCGGKMTVEHGRHAFLVGSEIEDTDVLQHHEDCPTCGVSTPTVCYDCEDCNAQD